jgi:invasion protein IalB
MTIKGLFFAAAAALAISVAMPAGAAFAQDKPAAKPRTAKSLACSAEADKKGLKGKERKKFRSACKRGKTTPS